MTVNKTGSYIPKGVNAARHFFVEVDMGSDTLANTDTLVVDVSAFDKDALPVALNAFTKSGSVWTRDADLPIQATSHDASTGKTTFTASGNIAANTKVIIEYIIVES